MKVRHQIKVFASIMEHKLSLNDHKGNFEEQDTKRLLRLLKDEVEELEEAIEEGDYFHILTEAADVANYACILAWNQLLKTTDREEEK